MLGAKSSYALIMGRRRGRGSRARWSLGRVRRRVRSGVGILLQSSKAISVIRAERCGRYLKADDPCSASVKRDYEC